MRRASEPKVAHQVARISLSYALAEWLRGAELEAGTREGYEGYIEHYIKPVLGTASIAKLTVRQARGSVRRAAPMPSGLRREALRAVEDHDCDAAECAEHGWSGFAPRRLRCVGMVLREADSAGWSC